MTEQPLIYEVALTIAPEAAPDCDAWLPEHVRAMLAIPGFDAADIHRLPDDAEGRARRLVRYRVRGMTELESYLHTHAPRMRAEGVARFGAKLAAARRVLAEPEALPAGAEPLASFTTPLCANCGARLTGRFCSACGQEDRTWLVSLGHLLHEFAGDLFNFDSRLWRSLWPLVARPGFLTVEYVAGRRMRYIPPVRLYLFVSLLFFALMATSAMLGSDGSRGMLAEERPVAASRQTKADSPVQLDIRLGEAEEGWLYDVTSRAGRRLEALGDDRAAWTVFLEQAIDNLPLMMFVLLPVYALFLKLLYLRSGRYYVEHLIFALHVHAFLFLAGACVIGWLLVLDLFGYEPAVPALLVAAFWLYLILYPWFAMRRVYGQGWFKTTLKYGLLGMAYCVTLMFGLVGVFIGTLAA
ncbi:MAG TPA: DUF4286 family protein [Gammaproteobacteria bacterium]|nr:DUF4286 family protein [Gammaproteobacteria bacterium]